MKYLTALLLTPALSWAHGENKAGPHGGHIRMPGAFHTELVLNKDQDLQIYLLDMNFKNPSIKDSKVEVYAKSNSGTQVTFKCPTMGGDHFHCLPEMKFPLNGELVVKAVREKAVGNEAVYKLPLPTLEETKKESKKESSEHHH